MAADRRKRFPIMISAILMRSKSKRLLNDPPLAGNAIVMCHGGSYTPGIKKNAFAGLSVGVVSRLFRCLTGEVVKHLAGPFEHA